MNSSNTHRSFFSSVFQNFGVPIATSAVAFLLTTAVRPYIHEHSFYLFQGAVAFSAWYGGFRAGLIAAAISIAAIDYFLIYPINTFSMGAIDLLTLAIFGAVAFATSWLSTLRRDKINLEFAQHQLEELVAQRTSELVEAEKATLEMINREQRRLGQDLHDGLCQSLAGLRLIAEDVYERLAARSAAEAPDMNSIQAHLGEALAQADIIARGLIPVELETDGLMVALQELTEKIPKMFPVKCQLKGRHTVHIQDNELATHLFRITQECIVNAVKRGKASRVNVRLLRRGDQGRLTIADNGVGIHNQEKRQGMGLQIMLYRARMMKASLRFYSRKRGGTVVRCLFPLS